jgi:hypothetical protein
MIAQRVSRHCPRSLPILKFASPPTSCVREYSTVARVGAIKEEKQSLKAAKKVKIVLGAAVAAAALQVEKKARR